MIRKLRTITSTTTVPYDNMALEACLLHHVELGEYILYLRQSRRTVVIDRNQSCFTECRCSRLEEDGGYLARRLSSDDAVFHDLGDLNFTFLVGKEDYSVEVQTEITLQTARIYGIGTERTDRNDVIVDGRKFSDNAYYQTGGCCYHRGAILIQVNKESMPHYLNVSKEKLQSKGVESVRSRVTNLTEFAPQMTVDGMKKWLTNAFSGAYGLPVERIKPEEADNRELTSFREQLSSWEWLYGKRLPFTFQAEQRFPWGGIQLQVEVDGGIVREARLYSDALDVELIPRLVDALEDWKYQTGTMVEAIDGLTVKNEVQERMRCDISQLIRSSMWL